MNEKPSVTTFRTSCFCSCHFLSAVSFRLSFLTSSSAAVTICSHDFARLPRWQLLFLLFVFSLGLAIALLSWGFG